MFKHLNSITCNLFLKRLHQDNSGSLSIASVFMLFMFTVLLMMIVNTATHTDDKLRMQNGADASAYSGGVVLARGMNAIAFSNQLMADVFGVTAYLREGRDRTAESLTPKILEAWGEVAKKFGETDFEKFQKLKNAILDKIPRERRVILAYGNMTASSSGYALPIFEYILEEEKIPEFQRAVIRSIPALVQETTNNIAWRHGLRQADLERLAAGNTPLQNGRQQQVGVLWRGDVLPVGQVDESNPLQRTLPVVDPSPFQSDFTAVPNPANYLKQATQQRKQWATHYVRRWSWDKMRLFDREVKMSQFSNLWRIATCGQLEKLLKEYPNRNLPMVLRDTETGISLSEMFRQGNVQATNRHLEDHYQFVATVYRKHLQNHAPKIFKNKLQPQSDALTFAQVALFPPAPRYREWAPKPDNSLGGTFGSEIFNPDPEETDPVEGIWVTESFSPIGWPTHWDLWNQNWSIQLVPATHSKLPQILQANPGQGVTPLQIGNLTNQELKRINTH
ncbi:hypothetical protein MNBD_PLANCTO02-2469 [hydrothermal vent metagenome]|uniref:Putative Flp pilus-assembly TadG-like N-terminal domain-containing protein n=1 Tax=hydrothermal vent metagenome TaxID=652676 RepID=A0A3B1DT87_9ZZZZ